MTTITILVGFLLNLVGLIGFFRTGSFHPTALIPSILGLPLMIAVLVAQPLTPYARHVRCRSRGTNRIGGYRPAFLQLPLLFQKIAGGKAPAILSKSATGLLGGLFILRSIQWFIQTRQVKKMILRS